MQVKVIHGEVLWDQVHGHQHVGTFLPSLTPSILSF